MDRINAPWRGEYVSSSGDDDSCFLCNAYNEDSKESDQDNFVLFRGKTAFVILNRYPYNTGHLMVVPNRHVSKLELLSELESCEIMEICKNMIEALKLAMNPHGFNVGFNLGSAAGAGVASHIHLHIVPRWNGDTNFMPVIANTRILPHDLKTVFNMLSQSLSSLRNSP